MSQEITTEKNTVEILFKKYYNPLYNFVNSKLRNGEDSKEVVQNCFMKLWKSKDKIDLDSPTIKSYLYAMARNALIDYVRKTKHSAEVDLENVDSETVTEEQKAEIDPFLIRTEIAKAMEALKPKTKEIFRLNKLRGFTYNEIAEELGISVRTVEDNMSRALGIMRTELRKSKVFDY